MGNKVIVADEQNVVRLIGEIKRDILSTQRKILADANRELIFLYFRIGKIISENQRYGNNFTNLLSASLKTDFPEAKGFSPRNLARMRKFYETYRDISNLPTALAKLPWSFNCLLIDRIEEDEKRTWYAEKCLENGWSFVALDHQIDLNLYQRQSNNSTKLTNFGEHLPAVQGELAQDLIKDPYIFELSGLTERSVERDIEKAMIERIKTVLLEFGQGFSFLGN